LLPDSTEIIRQAREQRTRDLERAIYGEKAWLWRQRPDLALRDFDDFVAWLNDVGLALFLPKRGVLLPSAREAVLGRPYQGGPVWMTEEWGELGGLWQWKDRLGTERLGYYGIGLLPHLSFVSLTLLPSLLALTSSRGRLASSRGRLAGLYEEGYLTRDAHRLHEMLTERGAMGRNALRRLAGLSAARLGRGLRELEADGLIARVGVDDSAPGWPSTIYATFEEAYPAAVDEAAHLQDEDARRRVLSAYLRLVPDATDRDARRALGWPLAAIEGTRARLA